MFKKLLIANRGEIAIRIARTAAEMGIATVAVFSEDDAQSLHLRAADEAFALSGTGAAAYLDAAQICAAAKAMGCEAVHPGYGFLSENAAFAALCAETHLVFVGPTPETLDLFGDKTKARALAMACGVPVLEGSAGPVTREGAEAFLGGLGDGGAVMLKAVAGGGGRGMRPVSRTQDMAEAYQRCSSEALKAFGSGDVYVERLLAHARHIEVQIAGDGAEVVHLWDRECSLQRQRQKLIEIAPVTTLADDVCARGCSTPPSGSARRPTIAAWAPSSSWSIHAGARRRNSSSSRPIRACRWSTRSPRRSPGSTWFGCSWRSPTAPRWPA